LVILSLNLSFAQQEGEDISVIQSTAIHSNATIQNIYIDNNTQWIATSKGLYKITANDTVESIQSDKANFTLLRQKRTNMDSFRYFDLL